MEERNIRNTQYSVQLPVVTAEEREKLIPELGAMILTTDNELLVGLLVEGQVAWVQMKL